MINNIYNFISKFVKPEKLFIPETNELKDMVVFISGANNGCGLALTKVLLKNSAKLVLFSRGSKNLDKVLENAKPGSYLLVQGDATNEKEVQKAVEGTIKKFGKIDVLVNCVGKFSSLPIEQTSLKEFNDTLKANTNSVFITSKAVAPYMKKQKNGLIINLGSKISRNSNITPNKVVYTTSKYAVEGFSNALGKELKKYNIRVTHLMPGTFNTFLSLKNPEYLSPYRVAEIILMIIKFADVDFEEIVFKSKHQIL